MHRHDVFFFQEFRMKALEQKHKTQSGIEEKKNCRLVEKVEIVCKPE